MWGRKHIVDFCLYRVTTKLRDQQRQQPLAGTGLWCAFPQDHLRGPQPQPPRPGSSHFLLWLHAASCILPNQPSLHVHRHLLCALPQKYHWACRCPQQGTCPQGKFRPSCREKANIGTREQILDIFCALCSELYNSFSSLLSPSHFPWIPLRVLHLQGILAASELENRIGVKSVDDN